MGGPFGVELPENIGGGDTGNETSDLAPDSGSSELAPDTQDTKISESDNATELTKETLDLDKVERFRFQGKEWTAKEMRDAYMMRADYTRKTQELADTRRYAENFDADLRSVIKDRNLLAEFKRIYPKSYIQTAESILERLSPTVRTPQTENQNQSHDPKELDRMLNERLSPVLDKVSAWEKAQYQSEVQRIGSWLDNQYERLSKKYQYADPEVITSRADLAHKNGVKVDGALLEKLFKANNTEIESRWSKLQESKVNKQIGANNRAKDIGPGGGVPGGAPKGFKTVREATQGWLKDLGV